MLEKSIKKIPPAKLDPAERKAKREAALREAKLAAKNIRKQSKSNRKRKVEVEHEGSLISGLSNVSSVPKRKQQKGKGIFKNPFRRKSKTDVAMSIPLEIIEEPKQKASRSKRASTTPARKRIPSANASEC